MFRYAKRLLTLAVFAGLLAAPAQAQGYGLFSPTPSTSPETAALWAQSQALLRSIHRDFGITPDRPMGRNYLETLRMIQEYDRLMAPARLGVLGTPQLDAELRRRNALFLAQEGHRYCLQLARDYALRGLPDHARAYKQWADYYGAQAARLGGGR
jgi:hypothetical protein